jgi:hypothetical protein
VHEIIAEVIFYKLAWQKLYECAERTQKCMYLVPKLFFTSWPSRSFMYVREYTKVHKISAEVIIYKLAWQKLYVCAENTQK